MVIGLVAVAPVDACLQREQSSAARELESLLLRNDLIGALEFGNAQIAYHQEDAAFREQFGRAFFMIAENLQKRDPHSTQIDRARVESRKHLHAARELMSPSPARLHWAIAVLDLQLKQPAIAIASCSQGLLEHPGNADLLAHRGKAKGKLGEWESAIADWRAALIVRPSDVSIAIGLGDALVESGRACDAAEVIKKHCLDSGTAESRSNWQTHYNYARYLIICRKFEESIGPLTEASRLAPNHQMVAVERAEMLWRVGQVEVAKTVLDQWLNRKSELERQNLIQALFRRATIASGDRDAETARRHFEEVLALAPMHEGALQGLGLLLMRGDEQDRGKKLLERFKRVAPVALDIRIVRQTIRRIPTSARPRVQLIGYLVEIPAPPGARLELAEFERLFPRHPELPELRRRVEAIASQEDER